MKSVTRIAIIGSGPSGLSCAVQAAMRHVPHVLLEAEDHVCHTVFRFQKGKQVMDEPVRLPLTSPLPFGTSTRETLLADWQAEIAQHKVNIKFNSKVTSITGSRGFFEIRTESGAIHAASHVVLCIGLQGNIRRLGIPGEDQPRVQYQLDDPGEYRDETIVVVGAGDAAIENALALAEHNEVILLNRNDEFTGIRPANFKRISEAIREERIDCRFLTSATCIDRLDPLELEGKPLGLTVRTAHGVEQIGCDRIIARLGAVPPRKLVESFGVRFANDKRDAIPQVSDAYESNVPGLFIVGALCGYPLIKHAMNQGAEVVDYIIGKPVTRADDAVLKANFGDWMFGTKKGQSTVAAGLALVQANLPLFSELTAVQMRDFMFDSKVLSVPSGKVIFKKGDQTDTLYSIIDGEIQVETQKSDGETEVLTLGRGAFFGDLSLLSGRRHAETVSVSKHCILLASPRRSVLALMERSDVVRRRMDEMALRRAVRMYIGPFLSEAELDELVSDAKIRRINAGDDFFKKGDEADGLYLIRRGSVTILRTFGGKEVVMTYVAAGNYVGEMALLDTNARRTATVRAAVNCEAIVLPASHFTEVMRRNPTLRSSVEARARERVSQNVESETGARTGNLIDFLVNQGLGEGTDVLLIDESLCIRCDNCEKACADVHNGISRLDRQAGPTFSNIHVPTSCRHCENPQCMKDCPPDAIHRDLQGEVVIDTLTCIGCGNCESNCPYGVIKLAQIKMNRKPPSLWAWLLLGASAEPGRENHNYDDSIAKKAVKCDMCKDLPGGAACVRACPTGAAIRVRPEVFMKYAAK